MRRSEKVPIFLAGAVVLLMVTVLSVRYLPIMPVSAVDSSDIPMTVNMKRMMLPLVGRYFPSVDTASLRTMAEELPYIEKARVSYSDGTLSLRCVRKDGYIAASRDEAYFISPDGRYPVSLEDLPMLGEIYTIVMTDDIDAFLSDAADDETILSIIASLDESGVDRRLIDSVEYGNNNKEISGLSLLLSDLGARIYVREAFEAPDIAGSIEAIRNEKRGLNPPFSEYMLYSDRLVRF